VVPAEETRKAENQSNDAFGRESPRYRKNEGKTGAGGAEKTGGHLQNLNCFFECNRAPATHKKKKKSRKKNKRPKQWDKTTFSGVWKNGDTKAAGFVEATKKLRVFEQRGGQVELKQKPAEGTWPHRRHFPEIHGRVDKGGEREMTAPKSAVPGTSGCGKSNHQFLEVGWYEYQGSVDYRQKRRSQKAKTGQ